MIFEGRVWYDVVELSSQTLDTEEMLYGGTNNRK